MKSSSFNNILTLVIPCSFMWMH